MSCHIVLFAGQGYQERSVYIKLKLASVNPAALQLLNYRGISTGVGRRKYPLLPCDATVDAPSFRVFGLLAKPLFHSCILGQQSFCSLISY